MLALERQAPSRQASLLHGTPVAAVGVLLALGLAAAAVLPADAARSVGLVVAHAAMLGTALAWTATDAARERWAPLYAAAVLAAATASARLVPGGGIAYLVVPAWLLWRWRSRWRGTLRAHARAALIGALFGLALGLHLLVNASLTLGYRVRPGGAGEVLDWVAYDLGANVLTAEAFFRAGLFRRAHRRWSFVAAAALATIAGVARYLVDPLLPRSFEIAAGATFYLALLGSGNCWLLARGGSLAAPMAAGLVFFAAYRLLAR